MHCNLGSLIWPLLWPSRTALSKLWASPFLGAPFSFSFCFAFISLFSSFAVLVFYFIYLFIIFILHFIFYYFYFCIIIYFPSVSHLIFLCFINSIQAYFLFFSLHFTFNSVPVSYFKLHCSIATLLQAPQFSFSWTHNS